MLFINEYTKNYIYDKENIIRCPYCNTIIFYINKIFEHKCPMKNEKNFEIDINTIRDEKSNFLCNVNQIENKCIKHNKDFLYYNESNYYCNECLKENKIENYVNLNEITLSTEEINNFETLIKNCEDYLSKIKDFNTKLIEKLKESYEKFEIKNKLLIEYFKSLIKINEKYKLNYNLISTIRRISIEFNIHKFKKEINKINNNLIRFYDNKNIITFNNNFERFFSSEKILGKGKYYYLKDSKNEGIFGKIYEGLSIKDKKLVAIKDLNNLIDKDYFNKISINLLKIMNNNDYCVKYLDLIEEKNKKFIVSELFNSDLKKEITNKEKGFSIKDIKKILCQINAGLKFKLKNAKCLHLNLTPKKILLNNNDKSYNKYKFCDYGRTIDNKDKYISEEIDEFYIDPEVIKNKKYSDKSDLFSIGILLYELYYGNNNNKLKQEEILKNIKNGLKNKNIKKEPKIKKTEEKFDEIKYIDKEFDNFKDLIENCIKKENRISWEDYFNHPFFNNEIEIELKINEEDLNNEIKIIGEHFNFFNKNNTKLYVNHIEKSFEKKIKFDDIGTHTVKFVFENYNIMSLEKMFNDCKNIEKIKFNIFNTSNVINMNQMFSSCSNLTKIEFKSLTTSNVKEMNQMFCQCENIKEINLTTFNTSKVENMSEMFSYCNKLEKIFLSSFNTINVKNMNSMFSNCIELKKIDLISFNTSNVTDMSEMFCHCEKLEELDLSLFNTSNVTNMSSMFSNCCNLHELDLLSFNTRKVEKMKSMFYNCGNLNEVFLTSFNTSNVIDMSKMFSCCNSLKKLDLSSFDTSKVKDMSHMFYYCQSLEEIDLSSFNNFKKIDNMFYNCSNLKKLKIKKEYKNLIKDIKEEYIIIS